MAQISDEELMSKIVKKVMDDLATRIASDATYKVRDILETIGRTALLPSLEIKVNLVYSFSYEEKDANKT